MELDLVTVSTLTALVVVVSGGVFITETLLREDDIVSRLWSLAFLCGIVTAVTYVIWALEPEMWWAVSIGNAAFAASAGFMWLGCRGFNGASLRWPGIVVGALTAATGAAVLVEGPDGGAWAGSTVMFLSLFLLPGAAAVEALRGSLGRIRTTLGFTFVLGVQSLYYLGRIVVSALYGTDSDTFEIWWGTVSTSFVTIMLMIVAVVVASVLRAERAALRGREALSAPASASAGLLDAGSFERLLEDVAERARARGECLAVISVRIDDLDRVAMAFGRSEADDLRGAWLAAMRAGVPSLALLGHDRSGGIAVGLVAESSDEIRAVANRLRRSIHEALTSLGGSVVPVFGIGVAVADAAVTDSTSLLRSARKAAAESEVSEDDGVVVAG